MKVKKSGFVCKIGYFFNPPESVPAQVNLCALVWRVAVSLPFVCLVRLLGFLITTMFFIFASFFGHYYSSKGVRVGSEVDPFPPYRLPTIFGKRILPIYLLFLIGFVWLAVWSIPRIPLELSELAQGTPAGPMLWATFGLFVVIEIIIVAMWFSWKYIRQSEPYLILRAWLKAKTERVCPVVELVE